MTNEKDIESDIENEIHAKGLHAPRLRPADIDAKIVRATYYVFPGTTLTVCCITLANGFVVTGESAAASAENFEWELGQKIAYANARDKVWMLEGYLLKERMFQMTQPAQSPEGARPLPLQRTAYDIGEFD